MESQDLEDWMKYRCFGITPEEGTGLPLRYLDDRFKYKKGGKRLAYLHNPLRDGSLIPPPKNMSAYVIAKRGASVLNHGAFRYLQSSELTVQSYWLQQYAEKREEQYESRSSGSPTQLFGHVPFNWADSSTIWLQSNGVRGQLVIDLE